MCVCVCVCVCVCARACVHLDMYREWVKRECRRDFEMYTDGEEEKAWGYLIALGGDHQQRPVKS